MFKRFRGKPTVTKATASAIAWRGLFLVCFGFLGVVGAAQPAHATSGINQEINYQGRLLNSAGATVADGTYNMEFKIYSGGTGCVSGGTSPCGGTLLWTEDWLGHNSQGVTVTNGYFSVMLGAASDPLGSLDSQVNFNQTPLWLSINIADTLGSSCTTFSGCTPDGEMLPFTQFAAAPYAFDAEEVGGIAGSSLVQLSPGSQQTGNINVSGSLTASGASALTLGSSSNAGSILFEDGVHSTGVTLTAASTTTPYSLTLPTVGPTTSQCLQSGATTASLLVFGSCSGGGSTLQGAYTASTSPQIVLNSTQHGLVVQDSSGGIGSNLFAVQSNGGGTSYLAVTASGASVAGTLAVTSTINSATISGGSLSSTAVDSLNVGANAISTGSGSLTIDANGSGTVSIGGTSTGDVLLAGGSGANGCTASNASGNFTCAGTLTGNAGLAASGGTVDLNASSNNPTNINTGSSTGAVGIGNSSAGNVTIASGSTASLAVGNTSETITSTGDTIQNAATSGSATAFQVQNAGSANQLDVNTKLGSVVVEDSSTTGNSGLPNTASTTLTTGTTPHGLTAGNFCNNGYNDLAVADGGAGAATSLFCNTGSGLPTTASSTLTAGTTPSSVTTSNFCNNGRADLAVSNSGAGTISVYCNTGTAGSGGLPTTASTTLTTGTNPTTLATGNFCNNGRADLVSLGGGSGGSSSLFCNTGTAGSGGLPTTTTTTLTSAGTTPGAATGGNFCGNGRTDLVIVYNGGGASLFCNTGSVGSGGLPTTASSALANNPSSSGVITSDFNGDGLADLAITNNTNNTALVFTNGIGSLSVTASSSTNQGEIIQGASGQTANLLQLQDSNGDPLDTVSSVGSLTVAGATLASVSGAAGTAASSILAVTASTGGAVSSGAFAGGAGGGFSLAAGNGGASSGATSSSTGGVGGSITITAGTGGNSSGTAPNASGGSITIQGGAPAFGGSGTAGTAGALNLNNTGGAINLATGSASVSTQAINIGTNNNAGSLISTTIGCSGCSASSSVTIKAPSAITITAGAASTWSTSSGALTITSAAAATWSTSAGALVVESASGSNFTASALGAGVSLFGTAGTGITEIGNTTAITDLTGPAYTTSSKGVCITASIGTCGATNGSILLLDLNQSTLQGAETAGNCSTTINAGGLYYSASTASSNTTTQELRGCINGAWKDIVTGDQLGIILLGVVPDSGTAANAGDIGGITGPANGPCRVSWASSTTVSVAPCTAYSNGRKVVVTAATTVTTAGLANTAEFYHICLNGTNNAPTATTLNVSETAGLPAFSATAPILCLATVTTSAVATPAINNIFDTRIFSNDTKQYISTVAAMAPGWIAVQSAANQVSTTTSANAANVMGVIGVGSTAASGGNTINAIMVSHGPAYAEAVSGTSTTFTAGNTAQTSATAGYASMAATAGGYKDLGLVIEPPLGSTCTSASNCEFSMYVNVEPH